VVSCGVRSFPGARRGRFTRRADEKVRALVPKKPATDNSKACMLLRRGRRCAEDPFEDLEAPSIFVPEAARALFERAHPEAVAAAVLAGAVKVEDVEVTDAEPAKRKAEEPPRDDAAPLDAPPSV